MSYGLPVDPPDAVCDRIIARWRDSKDTRGITIEVIDQTTPGDPKRGLLMRRGRAFAIGEMRPHMMPDPKPIERYVLNCLEGTFLKLLEVEANPPQSTQSE